MAINATTLKNNFDLVIAVVFLIIYLLTLATHHNEAEDALSHT